jgi:hypothetical protein
MVKGIGPFYTRRLVDKFGEHIFDIIKTESARLEELDRIGPNPHFDCVASSATAAASPLTHAHSR